MTAAQANTGPLAKPRLWVRNRVRALIQARGNPVAYRRKVRVGKQFEREVELIHERGWNGPDGGSEEAK